MTINERSIKWTPCLKWTLKAVVISIRIDDYGRKWTVIESVQSIKTSRRMNVLFQPLGCLLLSSASTFFIFNRSLSAYSIVHFLNQNDSFQMTVHFYHWKWPSVFEVWNNSFFYFHFTVLVINPILVRKISKCPKHILFCAAIGQKRTHDLDPIRFNHFIFVIFFYW